MGVDYLYFLMTEDGQFCYEQNGSVYVQSSPKPLRYTPDGWLDIEVQRQRNFEYFAIERSFTAPVDFVKDSATIVKYHYYNKGIEDKLYLAIADKRLYYEDVNDYLVDEYGRPLLDQSGQPIMSETMGEYGFYYSLLYKGEIDFSQFQHTGPKVTLTIMEGGVAKLLKANKNTKYDIPILKYDLVKMDGIRLKQKSNYIVTDSTLSGDNLLDNHIIDVKFISQEAISSIGAVDEQRFPVDSGNTNDLWNTDSFFLLSGATSTPITLTWDFYTTPKYLSVGNPDNGTELHLEFHVISSNTIHPISQVIQVVGGGDWHNLYDHAQHFSGSASFNIPAKSRCILYMSISKNSSRTKLEYNAENSSILLDYTYTHPPSYVRVVRLITLFKAIAEKMGIPIVYSSALAMYQDVVITCGDALRGLTDAVIKTSMSDFITSINTVLSIGLSVDGKGLRLEKKQYYVNYTSPIDLGEIKDLKVSPATDYIFNTIKIGYPEQNYDDVNGKQEFNNTHVYTTPVTRLSKELNLVSVYRADCYGAEFTRINLEGKQTTDSDSDNDVFMLHIKDNPEPIPLHVVDIEHYLLDRTLNIYVTGLIEPGTVFNLWLSPKQCLLRNGSFIHSCFFNQEDQWLKFQTTEKNSSMAVHVTGQPAIIEKADVAINTLGEPFFTPNMFEFDTVVPYDILELLKSNPLRSFTFHNDGVTYTGFPQKDSVQPASRKQQTFQMLSGPKNNLNNLIAFNG